MRSKKHGKAVMIIARAVYSYKRIYYKWLFFDLGFRSFQLRINPVSSPLLMFTFPHALEGDIPQIEAQLSQNYKQRK